MNHLQRQEWLETDGLGGYASGPVCGPRSRKYHGFLCAALTPPTKRTMFISDFLISIRNKTECINITTQQYKDALIDVDEAVRLTSFTNEPWPTWTYNIKNIGTLTKEFCMVRGQSTSMLNITLDAPADWYIECKPLLSGRDHHGLIIGQNNWLVSEIDLIECANTIGSVYMHSNGTFLQQSDVYYNIYYPLEVDRGYPGTEDLVCPGTFSHPKQLQLQCSTHKNTNHKDANTLWSAERKRRKKCTILERAAEHFIVQTGLNTQNETVETGTSNYSIIAGYPWFTDWGRDTFISMRGLLLSTKKYTQAESILLHWGTFIVDGLLPNRFIDESSAPEYNTIDAPLWYIICCHEYLLNNKKNATHIMQQLKNNCTNIIDNFIRGTKYNIKMDDDGLVFGGIEGKQLTWMDAKYGDHVITPRIGKPVEIQCLWINALWIASKWQTRYEEVYKKAHQNFLDVFWNEREKSLYDVIEVNNTSLKNDQIRCNQLFAIGGLPLQIVTGINATQLLETVTTHLLTPYGLRTLSQSDAEYQGNYAGNQESRDAAYHQGTVWPWLLGTYCDAWFNVHGQDVEQKNHIKKVVLSAVEENFMNYGLQGINEVCSGNEPYLPNGCPWQAWSLSEYMRIKAIYKL